MTQPLTEVVRGPIPAKKFREMQLMSSAGACNLGLSSIKSNMKGFTLGVGGGVSSEFNIINGKQVQIGSSLDHIAKLEDKIQNINKQIEEFVSL